MEKAESSLDSNLAKAIAREQKVAKLSLIVIFILFLAGVYWIYYSFNQVRKLQIQSAQLNANINQSKQDIEELYKKKKEVQEQLNDFYAAADLSGKRRQAVLLTLALQERNIPFVMGGRSPNGLDLSGFIIYVLSRPGIEIMKQSDLLYCDQPCLELKTKVTKATSLPPDLKPGDLIFYAYNHTMMYLGNNKCRGMIYQEGIQTRDVNFWPIIGYSRISYGD
jgi:cell wall-associated NlpC family hydrolase